LLYFPRQAVSSWEITGFWGNVSTEEPWNNRLLLQVLLPTTNTALAQVLNNRQLFTQTSSAPRHLFFTATQQSGKKNEGPKAGEMKAKSSEALPRQADGR